MMVYKAIYKEITEEAKLDSIGVVCYVCNLVGHISVNCP
jgi:hypothetical protein